MMIFNILCFYSEIKHFMFSIYINTYILLIEEIVQIAQKHIY